MNNMTQPYPMNCCGQHPMHMPQRCCRREAKELLVKAQPADKQAAAAGTTVETNSTNLDTNQIVETSAVSGTAVIGGGCCVELSIEYMPLNPTVSNQTLGVTVEVLDSEGCMLGWRRTFSEGYHVKQGIITTYPGAQLTVTVLGAIARVRWCEVFSC
jgi:hypothetical protein